MNGSPPASGTGRNTAGFFVSSLFAFIGGHVMNYSVILYSQDVLGSTALAGLAFFLCFFPPLLLGLYAGVLCDRYSTKTLIGMAQGVFMLAACCLLAIRLLAVEATVARALVLLAGGLNGLAWSFIAPARYASLGRLVPASRLGQISVLFNLVVMVGFGAAPVFIGLTTQAWGWTATFAMGLGLFTLAQLTLPPVRMWWTPPARERTVMREFTAGLAYLRQTPLLAQLLGISVVGFLTMGPIQVLWPRFARIVLELNDAQRGLYLGTLALALIVGGALATALRARLHNGHAILLGPLLLGASIMAIPVFDQGIGPISLIALSGVVAGLVVSFIVAGLQTQTEDLMRGRIMSFYTIGSQVGPASAGLAAGLVADAFGVTAGLTFSGAVIAGLGVLGLLGMARLRAFSG